MGESMVGRGAFSPTCALLDRKESCGHGIRRPGYGDPIQAHAPVARKAAGAFCAVGDPPLACGYHYRHLWRAQWVGSVLHHSVSFGPPLGHTPLVASSLHKYWL